jgi:hypothetical protein
MNTNPEYAAIAIIAIKVGKTSVKNPSAQSINSDCDGSQDTGLSCRPRVHGDCVGDILPRKSRRRVAKTFSGGFRFPFEWPGALGAALRYRDSATLPSMPTLATDPRALGQSG